MMLNFKSSILLAAISLAQPLWSADFLTGQINDLGNQEFEILSPKGKFKIEATDKIKDSLPSLANPVYVQQSNGNPYSYEFKGELKGNTFILAQTPTNIAGPSTLEGKLIYDETLDQYKINNQIVEFGYTKELNHFQFDEISKKSFVGKNVIADGEMIGDRFIMQAITPEGLFSASIPKRSKFDPLFNEDPFKFIEETVYKNEISKSQDSFRRIIYNQEGYTAKPGESVFLVTLSGRQGDSFGSVNGHFVAGLGEVKEDLSLRAEVSNAYVVNGKDILSGNTSLTNYFSNFVQGQNNYRPTYTFLVYGIDKEKLQKFRDFLEHSHIEFRTKDLEITLEFNCTTETAKGLSLAGIVGNHKRTLVNRLFDANNLAIPLRPIKYFGEGAEALAYVTSHDKEDFQPRPAFHSYIDSFKYKKVIKELGIKRMDYVFYGQIPSARPIGGAPSNITFSPINKYDSLYYRNLYEKHEANEDQSLNASKEELLKLLPLLDHVQ